jgi:Ca-activated chloride channel family protein
MHTSSWREYVLYALRFLVLAALCLAVARLREPDERSKVPVQGIDIMLVFDASGSMQLIDDRAIGRSRIDSAREEARTFIKKRIHDPMGLVIFSGVAVTRCPLTLDKHMLDEIVAQTGVDTIPVEGTVISEAIIVAANRLKKSKAASRIMIVLTDGAPSPHDKSPQVAAELAKKLGIKIYTIGVGSPEGGWYFNNFFGWQQHRTQYNEKLLHYFAQETGGSSFVAHNPEELERIYTTIDQLERSEHEMPQYAHYVEYFIYFLWIAAVLLVLELLLSTLLWVRL